MVKKERAESSLNLDGNNSKMDESGETGAKESETNVDSSPFKRKITNGDGDEMQQNNDENDENVESAIIKKHKVDHGEDEGGDLSLSENPEHRSNQNQMHDNEEVLKNEIVMDEKTKDVIKSETLHQTTETQEKTDQPTTMKSESLETVVKYESSDQDINHETINQNNTLKNSDGGNSQSLSSETIEEASMNTSTAKENIDGNSKDKDESLQNATSTEAATDGIENGGANDDLTNQEKSETAISSNPNENDESIDKANGTVNETDTKMDVDTSKNDAEKSVDDETAASSAFSSMNFTQNSTSLSYGSTALDEMVFSIPNDMVGVVIGRGGENIHRIQREFGISIQIAKLQENASAQTPRQVILKGLSSNLTFAKLEVDKLIAAAKFSTSQVAGSITGQTAIDSIKMAVPNDKVGLIIGKQGGTIKGIQFRTQAQVQIPVEADADDPTRRTITINAPTKLQVDRAMREIQNVLDVGIGNPSIANTIIMQVPNDRVGLIIGKGGVTIKELQNRTGARIQIPAAPDPGTNIRSVTITGVGDAPLRAKYEIEQLISNAVNQYHGMGAAYGMAPMFNASPYTQQASPYGANLYAQQQYQSYPMPSAQAPAVYGHPYQKTDPYAQMQPRPIQHQATPVQNAAGVDMTQYHTQFWQYAAYYGERVAREQYGPWAPPMGTAPPSGIVLPMPGQEQPAATSGLR